MSLSLSFKFTSPGGQTVHFFQFNVDAVLRDQSGRRKHLLHFQNGALQKKHVQSVHRDGLHAQRVRYNFLKKISSINDSCTFEKMAVILAWLLLLENDNLKLFSFSTSS